MDKENTPPPERRGPRAITPPANNERHLPPPEDVKYTLNIILLLRIFWFIQDETASHRPGYADDKANIESGHAKAVRER